MAAEDRGPQIAAVAILFLTLTWIFVGLRCYVRTVMMKSFGMDDWLAVAALVSLSVDKFLCSASKLNPGDKLLTSTIAGAVHPIL